MTKRTLFTFAVTLALGIVLGAMATGLVGAAHPPVKVSELVKTDLVTADGREGTIFLADLAPGANVGKHYHPGDAFAYILEGTMVLEVDDQPPVTLKPGDSGHVAPRQVHDDRNASTTAPLRFLVFHIAPKGQPLAVMVR